MVLSDRELRKLSVFYVPTAQRGWLLMIYAILVFCLFVLIVSRPVAPLSIMASLLVCTAALIPAFLWILGKAPGLPLFPLIAATYVFSYGLPLVAGSAAFLQYTTLDNMVINYTPSDHFHTAVHTCLFLVVATLVWLLLLSLPVRPPQKIRVMEPIVADGLFLIALCVAMLFYMSSIGQWFEMEPGTFSLIRMMSVGLSTLSIAILFYRLGLRELPKSLGSLSLVLLLALSLTACMSLYLNQGLLYLCLALAAFTVGRRRIPYLATIAVFCWSFVLHHGKGEMRYDYWHLPKLENRSVAAVQPYQYPEKYLKWIRYGLDDLRYTSETDRQNNLADWKLLDRLGIVQNFLLVRSKVTAGTPYLHGASFKSIPTALIPRVLYPGKKSSPHDGQFLMNTHFGLQNATTVGRWHIEWGLLAESYANFGVVGVVMCGVLTGILLGLCTRISEFAPILSLRTLLGAAVGVGYLQLGSSLAIFVTTMTQGLILIGLVGLFLMREEHNFIRVPKN